MEKFAYHTFKSSNELAAEKGTYELYEGSEWSKGIIIGKDKKWFEENSTMAKEWKELIKNIKKDGMRFAYHLAPAPNTSTA
jgi:ribonucleoside-diphosphate reductase alpha chain